MEKAGMSRKRFAEENVIGMLREAEVTLTQAKKVGKICRSLGISEQSYYRWLREYGAFHLSSPEAQLLIVKFYNIRFSFDYNDKH
jgi:putative transposase